jgi:hypothetical protein
LGVPSPWVSFFTESRDPGDHLRKLSRPTLDALGKLTWQNQLWPPPRWRQQSGAPTHFPKRIVPNSSPALVPRRRGSERISGGGAPRPRESVKKESRKVEIFKTGQSPYYIWVACMPKTAMEAKLNQLDGCICECVYNKLVYTLIRMLAQQPLPAEIDIAVHWAVSDYIQVRSVSTLSFSLMTAWRNTRPNLAHASNIDLGTLIASKLICTIVFLALVHFNWAAAFGLHSSISKS